jgi:hypothetical protein
VNKEITWENKADKNNGLLPGYPVAFLIAKDIVVRIIHDKASSKEQKAASAANATSSGGCLCFSYSQSDSSRSSSESSGFQAFSNGYVIKIPGPQVRFTAPALAQIAYTHALFHLTDSRIRHRYG